MTMKLLCLNYEYPPIGGGGAVASKGLAEALAKLGYGIDVVTSGMKGSPPRETIGEVNIHRVRGLRRHRHYTTTAELLTQIYPIYRRALRLTREGQYELNHTHFIFPTALAAYWLKRRTGLPYIITVHGSDVPGYNPDRFQLEHKLLHWLWRAIVADSAGLICPSKFITGLVRQYTDKPVTIIPNGIDIKLDYTTADKSNRILIVTRLFKRKGVQYLLEAVRDLDAEWEVLVVGDGPYLPTLKKLANGVRPKVHFTGYLKGQELHDAYHSAKIFVFPSIQENFPVVLLEAMQAGCAVITTDVEGCSEVIGDAGIATRPHDSAQIRDALLRLIHNEDEIAKYGHLALERVRQFDWSSVARQYHNAFEQMLNARRPAAD
jgi:glycosyltransferase involved in cell wall biosynthesis